VTPAQTRTLWRRWRARLARLEERQAAERAAELAAGRAVLVRAAVLADDGPADLVGLLRRASGGALPLAGRLALEYVWHVVGADPGAEVRWNTAPGVHAVHVADLAAWSAARNPAEVREALRGAADRIAADV
jgi:hypothetical protein